MMEGRIPFEILVQMIEFFIELLPLLPQSFNNELFTLGCHGMVRVVFIRGTRPS